MNNGIQILIIVAAVIAAAVYIGIRQRRQAERQLRRHLEGQFGKAPDKVMSPERYARVPGYFLHHRPADEIDDITWNDLDMDAVYQRIDSTQSAAGEEYLYALLRSPAGGPGKGSARYACSERDVHLREDSADTDPGQTDGSVFRTDHSGVRGGLSDTQGDRSGFRGDFSAAVSPRYEDIEYYRKEQNRKERTDLQMALRKLGTPGRASMYDFIDPLKKAVPDSNRKHLPAFVLPAVSIVILFLNVPAGILCLIFSMIVNMASYYHFKAKADPYIGGLSYLLKMMRCGDDVLAAAEDKVTVASEAAGNNRSTAASDAVAAGNKDTAASDAVAAGNKDTPASDAAALAADFLRLRDLQKGFAGMRRGSGILISGSSTSGGNPVDFIIDYIRILFHIDLIKFNSMLGDVQRKMPEIDEELTILGRIDTVIALASFEESLPYTCRPEMDDVVPADCEPAAITQPSGAGEPAAITQPSGAGEPVAIKQPSGSCEPSANVSFTRDNDVTARDNDATAMDNDGAKLLLKEIYHPLLADPVPNSLETDRSILLTGSNASGKSTFLKSVALCALFAQTIGFCPAREYHGTRFRIRSSMALRDNILNGESYFMVEIRSLKRIADLAGDGGRPVLCFIDEVLRGTNTVERIAASSVILKTLADRGVLVFAATHDIELTRLLKNKYRNMHFEEEMGEKDVLFSYKIHEGPAASRNAIRLLAATGFDSSVTEEAQRMAEQFEQTGEWAWELDE